jgi:hypothetical protein
LRSSSSASSSVVVRIAAVGCRFWLHYLYLNLVTLKYL